MKNPNRNTSPEVLRRLKEGSNERMRVELKCSLELLMNDFDFTWDDIAKQLGMKRLIHNKPRADVLKKRILGGQMTLRDLNTLAHIFSTEPYIIFRPREPWVKT